MDGGQVRLEIPGAWALDGLQGDDPDGENYVKVQAESGGELREDSAIGTDRVVAYLGDFGYNNVVRFTFDNLQAQRSLGIAKFIIHSAGTRGANPIPVFGAEAPDGTDTELKKVALKKVLQTGVAADDTDGLILYMRLATVSLEFRSAAAATGPVQWWSQPLELKAVRGTYLDDEGETITDERIHAGDSETHIRFVYDPIETISNGELKFTVAANWD